MKSKLSRHCTLFVGALALVGASAALATSPSIDPTITTVMDSTELNEAMDKEDLHEEALNDIDDGAKENGEHAQEGQQEVAEANQEVKEAAQEVAEANQEAAEAIQDGAHDAGDAKNNVEGV
jgi:gas vesicle protein